MSKLSNEEIDAGLAGLDGWTPDDGRITAAYRLAGFPQAVAFVVRLSYPAEAADHHPDLELHYDRVRVTLSTHSEGGVTAKDLALARIVAGIAGEVGATAS